MNTLAENTSDFSYLPIRDGLYIKYSRTYDSLSVKRLVLSEGRPCMVPDDVNFNSSKKLYPLEKVTDKDGCTLERNNKLRHDPRYRRISGFNISEY